MTQAGNFGYKIGKKIRLMRVTQDADLLWQIGVRELYVLLHKYKTMSALRDAFAQLKQIKPTQKQKPTTLAREKCKWFSQLDDNNEEWSSITQYCQHSYINVLESGYLFNNGVENGLTLLLDFNTETLTLYQDKKVHQSATMADILAFDAEEMPTNTYDDIVGKMKERYIHYQTLLRDVDNELQKIEAILDKAKELGHEQNIMQKANKMKSDAEWQKKKIHLEYRFFYYRLDALNLIDYSS